MDYNHRLEFIRETTKRYRLYTYLPLLFDDVREGVIFLCKHECFFIVLLVSNK